MTGLMTTLISPRAAFLGAILLGLLLGVRAMIVGIARTQERLRASVFNLPTVGSWLVLFGFVGYLLDRYTTLGVGVVLALATVGGLAAASGMYALINGWALPSAARDVEDVRYILQGHVGRVSREIGGEGDPAGEITYDLDDQHHTVAARALDGSAIPLGTEIVIERVEGEIAYVERWSVIEKQLEME